MELYLHSIRLHCVRRAYVVYIFTVINSNIFENCALLGHYAASSDNFLLKFRDNLSLLSSGVNSFGFLTH